jgi:hypothetical protein
MASSTIPQPSKIPSLSFRQTLDQKLSLGSGQIRSRNGLGPILVSSHRTYLGELRRRQVDCSILCRCQDRLRNYLGKLRRRLRRTHQDRAHANHRRRTLGDLQRTNHSKGHRRDRSYHSSRLRRTASCRRRRLRRLLLPFPLPRRRIRNPNSNGVRFETRHHSQRPTSPPPTIACCTRSGSGSNSHSQKVRTKRI